MAKQDGRRARCRCGGYVQGVCGTCGVPLFDGDWAPPARYGPLLALVERRRLLGQLDPETAREIVELVQEVA